MGFFQFLSESRFKQFNSKYIGIYAKNGYGDAFGLPTYLSEMKIYMYVVSCICLFFDEKIALCKVDEKWKDIVFFILFCQMPKLTIQLAIYGK